MKAVDVFSRILMIGPSAQGLETILAELGSMGYEVQGTTHADCASLDFNAEDFDLIAICDGIDLAFRARLKADLRRQNPGVQLLDVFAPAAVRQVAETLQGRGDDYLVDLDAYFQRIGYDGPKDVSFSTLSSIHQHHLDAIPFEALDVVSGKGVDVSPKAVETKLVKHRKGGYGLEHNPLLQNVLRQLGFQVTCLPARVLWQVKPGAKRPPRTHVVLKVVLDDQPFLVDAGFGSAVLPSPIRMDLQAPQTTTHENYRVFPFGNGYRLQMRRGGTWCSLYDVDDEPIDAVDLEMMNWYASQHPGSLFRGEVIVTRTTREARYVLINSRLIIRTRSGKEERSIFDPYDMAEVLWDLFGLSIEPFWRPVLVQVLNYEFAIA